MRTEDTEKISTMDGRNDFIKALTQAEKDVRIYREFFMHMGDVWGFDRVPISGDSLKQLCEPKCKVVDCMAR